MCFIFHVMLVCALFNVLSIDKGSVNKGITSLVTVSFYEGTSAFDQFSGIIISLLSCTMGKMVLF